MTGPVVVTKGGGCGGGSGRKRAAKGGVKSCEEEEQQNQISFAALLLSALRKSMVSCRVDREDEAISPSVVHHMEIGWPTNVRHVSHVTFDRFNGFLGLPVEFQFEVPCRVPSASATVFGISAGSMQCSLDSKGNSIPTILLLMQERLYSQGGLKAEGIFRINPENSQEELVRDQLNWGIVPDDINVHCLAGLIKAWFRELPSGVLDGLSPEQVLGCDNEDKYVELVKQLKSMEAGLLDWAVDLMADVVKEEGSNKMNARNIAMVFAPNMTKMSDPLTALMHAVQVMNLLQTLIVKTLREREETASSSYAFDGPTDDEFDCRSLQEINTSCEEPMTDYDNSLYANSSGDDNEYEDENEIEPLGEIAVCFSRELHDEKKKDVTKNENSSLNTSDRESIDDLEMTRQLSYQRKGKVYLLTDNEDVERFIAYISVSQDNVTLYVVEPRSSEVGSVAGNFDDVSAEETDHACNDFDIGQYPNFDDETATAEKDAVDDNEEEVTTVNEHVEHPLCNSYNPEEEKEEEEIPEESATGV
ncbi:Rho GTPase-activating protein 1 [Hibiscus syriacus]|uniref:Rho GTPase-activating protein 1 n=1 Tax=Hibiscus syriacus TaxID=106335 RepID=A0A6A2XSL2_HIBSY|nr:Rho GTPase-activating protein 1 [Hibiscus syriacus]